MRTLRPAFASVLEHGHPVRFGPEGVELAYPPKTFYWDAARETDNRQLLEKVLAEHFGQSVSLSLVTLDETAGAREASIAEADAERRRQRVEQIRNDALEHPAVRGAISILGGEVKEIIPLAADLKG